MLAPNQVLQGRYRVERHLQDGGMSAVYVAFDTSLDARVAIKEMRGHFLSPSERVEAAKQFRLEAQMVANLDHAGLPRVTNYFESGETSYLVMDLIDGDSMERMLNHWGKPCPMPLALVWMYEVSQVLDYLHNRNPQVIFRDLKPSNIMVTREGHIKLIDFGISKVFDKDTGGGTRTIIKGAGTPGYAPPEQYGTTAKQRTDPRSDIYALGATLYTILAFQVPPEATDRWMNQVPVVPVREYNSTIPPALEGLIDRMMALKQDERPASVREVMAELLQALGGTLPSKVEVPPEMVLKAVEAPPVYAPSAGIGENLATVVPGTMGGVPMAVPTGGAYPQAYPTGQGQPFYAPPSGYPPGYAPPPPGYPQPYGAPPTAGVPYAAPPTAQAPYGAPPTAPAPYGAPPTYGAPPGAPYGAPPTNTPYGAGATTPMYYPTQQPPQGYAPPGYPPPGYPPPNLGVPTAAPGMGAPDSGRMTPPPAATGGSLQAPTQMASLGMGFKTPTDARTQTVSPAGSIWRKAAPAVVVLACLGVGYQFIKPNTPVTPPPSPTPPTSATVTAPPTTAPPTTAAPATTLPTQAASTASPSSQVSVALTGPMVHLKVARPVSGMTVYVDGVPQPVDPGGGVRLDLPMPKAQERLKVVMPGYQTFVGTVAVSDGQEHIDVTQVPKVTLTVLPEPKDAHVSVKLNGVAITGKNNVFGDLDNGHYKVHVEHSGYYAGDKEVWLHDQSSQVPISLKEIPPPPPPRPTYHPYSPPPPPPTHHVYTPPAPAASVQ